MVYKMQRIIILPGADADLILTMWKFRFFPILLITWLQCRR